MTETKKSCNRGACIFKSIIAIVLVGITANLLGYYFWMDLYKDLWMAEEFMPLWRAEGSEQWQLMPLAYVIYAVVFVLGYCKFACCTKCPLGTKAGGGAIFGIYVWMFTGVLAGLWMYIIHPVSQDIAMIVVKESLAVSLLSGIITGILLGKSSEEGKSCSA